MIHDIYDLIEYGSSTLTLFPQEDLGRHAKDRGGQEVAVYERST
jgi:hypothetical protein